MDLRSIDLNLLVTFEALVDERSVSRAAERLGLTQSAVSHALARLRLLFRDELMVRGPSGMEPTTRALQIAGGLAGPLSAIEQVIDQDRHFHPATTARRFTLHVSDYVAPFLLPTLCQRLRAEAPNVSLQIKHFNDPGARVEPLETHLRVADQDAPANNAVEDVRLFDDDFVVLMSAGHPQADRPLTLEAYLDLVHVKVSPTALGTNVIDDALGAQDLERRVAITVPSWFEMRSVVANTDMVVAMPRRWAGDPAFAAGCVWQPLPLRGVAFSVDLRSRRRDRNDPGTQWLRDLISNSVV